MFKVTSPLWCWGRQSLATFNQFQNPSNQSCSLQGEAEISLNGATATMYPPGYIYFKIGQSKIEYIYEKGSLKFVYLSCSVCNEKTEKLHPSAYY